MVLPRSRQLARMWKILREADLQALRRAADTRFEILIGGDRLDDVETLARLVSGGDSVHPWLVTRDTPAAAAVRDTAPVALALLVTRDPASDAHQGDVRDTGPGPKTPILRVVIGPTDHMAVRPRRGEKARVAVTALDDANMSSLAPAIVEAVPSDLHLALARQLPPLRDAVFRQLVDDTAKTNASYSLSTGLAEIVPILNVPANLGDMVILTKNQLIMSYKIALAAGKQGKPKDVIGEIAGVLGGGFLFRQIARQLIGLVPVAGIAPKVAVAYGGTWAIGRAVVLWATEGQKVSPDMVRSLYREGMERGRRAAEGLMRRQKPVQEYPGAPKSEA